jgi:T5orf172 domain
MEDVEAVIMRVLLHALKIGWTRRDPKSRAADLSGTALPTSFEVVYDAYFADARAVEQFLHITLAGRGLRVSSDREFFRMSVPDAVRAVLAAEAIFQTATPCDEPAASDEVTAGGVDEICDVADALYYGRGEVLEDVGRAIAIYRQAAAAGSVRAILSLAEAWLSERAAVDWDELRPLLQGAIDAAVAGASAYMAVGMIRCNHAINARKCWDRFWTQFAVLPDRTRILWASRYIALMPLEAVTAGDRQALQPDRDAVLSRIAEHAPQLKGKAEMMLFPDFLERLPRIPGRVTQVESDGVMIRSTRGLERVYHGDALTESLRVGQAVEFVTDPLTHRVRVIRAQ